MGYRHRIVCGLGFGDEGKGSVTDFLCSQDSADPAHAVVRFNGGAQAGHNVVTADGRHHTFAQFGSGSFTPGVRTHLSRFMLVACVALVDSGYLRRLLRAGPVVFEGAQGILLDEWRGFHPYTTWSTTTFANAETLLAEAGQTAFRLGVVRSYLTRHGPGPFVTEDPTLELSEPHNRHGDWQGAFRAGHLDAVALRYAIEIAGGVDALAVTHLDTAARSPLRLCRSYQVGGRRLTRIAPGPERDLQRQERLTRMLLRARPVYEDPGQDWPGVIEEALGAPVALRSYGPVRSDMHAADVKLKSAM